MGLSCCRKQWRCWARASNEREGVKRAKARVKILGGSPYLRFWTYCKICRSLNSSLESAEGELKECAKMDPIVTLERRLGHCPNHMEPRNLVGSASSRAGERGVFKTELPMIRGLRIMRFMDQIVRITDCG